MTIAEQFNLALEFMLLGMGVVFAFLAILIFVVKWTGAIIQRIEPSNTSIQQNEALATPALTPDDTITAVISAAIHQYQTRHPAGKP